MWMLLGQVLYPILMILLVSRTFLRKVRPHDSIVFKDGSNDESTHSFAAKVKNGLKEDHSMFAWANKGEWESVESSDTQVKRDRDWFRIGFEPLFVDFTKNGSWFIVYMLVEVSLFMSRWMQIWFSSR